MRIVHDGLLPIDFTTTPGNPQRIFNAGPVAPPFTVQNFSRSPCPLWFGPTKATADLVAVGHGLSQGIDSGEWPELWLLAKWSQPSLRVVEGVAITQQTRMVGTTFKGAFTVDLPPDGSPVLISDTVVGCDSIILAQDPRNASGAMVWVSTHVEGEGSPLDSSRNTLFDGTGKLVPGVKPTTLKGQEKKFPLLRGQYLPIHEFNAWLFAWRDVNPAITSPVRIYYAKHASGV